MRRIKPKVERTPELILKLALNQGNWPILGEFYVDLEPTKKLLVFFALFMDLNENFILYYKNNAT